MNLFFYSPVDDEFDFHIDQRFVQALADDDIVVADEFVAVDVDLMEFDFVVVDIVEVEVDNVADVDYIVVVVARRKRKCYYFVNISAEVLFALKNYT